MRVLADLKKSTAAAIKGTTDKVASMSKVLAMIAACAAKGEVLGKGNKCVSVEQTMTREDKYCAKGKYGVQRWVDKTLTLEVSAMLVYWRRHAGTTLWWSPHFAIVVRLFKRWAGANKAENGVPKYVRMQVCTPKGWKQTYTHFQNDKTTPEKSCKAILDKTNGNAPSGMYYLEQNDGTEKYMRV